MWDGPPAWLYLPHLGLGGGQDLLPVPSSISNAQYANVDDTPRATSHAGIRGRTDSRGSRPSLMAGIGGGANAQASCPTRRGGRSEAVVDTPAMRTMAGGGTSVDRAAERLAARNAGISISLSHHAERVGMKDAKGRRPPDQTAAERMAALRRRVSARSGLVEAPGPPGCHTEVSDQAETDSREKGRGTLPLPASKEDDKIHQLHGLPGIHLTTACQPRRGDPEYSPRELGDGERAGHGDDARGAAQSPHVGSSSSTGGGSAAARAAAALTAWHSNLAAAGGDAGDASSGACGGGGLALEADTLMGLGDSDAAAASLATDGPPIGA